MNIRSLLLAAFLLGAPVPLAWHQAGSTAPPARLWAAQTGPKEITLVWTRVPGGVRYRIYDATAGDARLVGETMASGEQYVRAVSAYGIPHRFAIEVVFENGEVSARAPFNPVVPQEARPGVVTAPVSVKAASSPRGTVSITWDAVPGATAYRIARQIVPGGFQILCRLCPTDTTYEDTTATGGARHIYTVAAVAASGSSRPTRSNEFVGTGGAAPAAARPPAAEVAPPKGAIHVTPVPGSCLSLGEQGNMLVRLADGSVRFFERVHYGRNMRIVESPGFKPVPGIVNAAAVATSGPHSLVLINDGTIVAWGRNTRGQLGDPATRDLLSDVPVAVRGITNAVAVAAGSDHSVALLADGTIRVWGSGDRGIPGDGRGDVRTNRVAPATVAGISNATGVAAGALTNFALLADGTVRAWGSNWGGLGFFGVLGIGNQRIQDSPTPLPVEGISNATAITTSGISSLALLADGRVMAWGAAQAALRGQREDWLTTSRPLVVPGIRNAAAVSPFLILLADGSVRELRSPEQRVAGIDNAVAVASDPTNRYALLADGRLVGWGLRQFWPKGMVTVAEFGAETARECSARSK